MSHHYSPQIQSHPSVKDHRSLPGFVPTFSLSSSGSSTFTNFSSTAISPQLTPPASFWPEQKAALLDKNIERSVDVPAWRNKEMGHQPFGVDTYSTDPHRDEVPTSSTGRISQPGASTFQGLKHSGVGSSSKDWSLMRNTNGDTSRHFSSSGASGFDESRVSCSEQTDDAPFIPEWSENSVSALPPETSPPRYSAESAADILMAFGLVKEDLLELDSYPKDELTPENLPLILHQISIKKRKRAAGVSSELHRSTSMSSKTSLDSKETVTHQNKMPKSILKKRKVMDFGASGIPSKDEIEKTSEDRCGRGDASLSNNQRPSGCSQEVRSAVDEENRVQYGENQQNRDQKGPVSKGLPPSSMVNDYTSSTPRVFPHTCSLCNKECVHMQEWFSHQSTSFHQESRRLLQKQFPEWDGEERPSISGKTKALPSTSQILQRCDQKTSCDGHSRPCSPLNSRSSEVKMDNSAGSFWSSIVHHQSNPSHSYPHDKGSFRCSEGQVQKSRSRSRSNSPCHHHGSKDSRDRSVSPHRETQCVYERFTHSEQVHDVQCIPGLGEDPVTSQSALPFESSPPRFTAESAENLLLSFGLVKEDLAGLASYPENEITPDSLPYFLRQIRIQKQKIDGRVGNSHKASSNKSVDLQNNLNVNKNPAKMKKKTKNKKTTDILGGSNLVHCRVSGVPVGGKNEKTSKPSGGERGVLQVDNEKFVGCSKESIPKNVKTNDSDSVTNLSSKKGPFKQSGAGHLLTSETNQSCTKRPNCPASKNSNHEQSKTQEKGIIAGKEKGNQQTAKHGQLQQTQPGFKTDKDLQHQFASTHRAPFCPRPTFNDVDHMPLSPSNLYLDKLSRFLPLLCQMNDYAAITPKVFPYTCSICNTEGSHNMADWFSHQMSSFHLERCKGLRQQYPLWDGQVRKLSRSRSRSLTRSKSRSRSRSRTRSRSPHSFRDTHGSQSRSWSPFYHPSTSRSKERQSPFHRKDDEWSSLRRRSFEQNISPTQSHERPTLQRLSHETIFHRQIHSSAEVEQTPDKKPSPHGSKKTPDENPSPHRSKETPDKKRGSHRSKKTPDLSPNPHRSKKTPDKSPYPHRSKETPDKKPSPHRSKKTPDKKPSPHRSKETPDKKRGSHRSKKTPDLSPNPRRSKKTPDKSPNPHRSRKTPDKSPNPHRSKKTPDKSPNPHRSKETPDKKPSSHRSK
nr:uncharacterized protein LOC107376905 [Nothobranchius furzeri]